MRMIATVFAAALLAACATQPATPVPPAPVASTAGPATTTAVAPATGTTTASVETAAAGAPKTRIPPGYKLVERDGARLLCTRTTTLGSRFPKEICMTEAEYIEMEERNEGMRQDLRKSIGVCGGGTGVGSCSGA